jgi:predicted phage terminase large subunit-like protein
MNAEELKEACREDLQFLCTEILGFSDWGEVHNDMESFLHRPSRRKLCLVPRGHLKTSVVTKATSIRKLLKNPNERILIANQVWDKAREMLFEIKEVLSDKSILPRLFGNFVSSRWREDDITIAQRTKALSAPSIGTTGVEAEMTSAHYDTIIADDLQGEKNCLTKEQRDKVKRFYRSLIDLLEPDGELIVVGTRWHQDDLYAEILEQESAYYDVMLRRVVEEGKVIFPKKFNLKFDESRKNWVFHPTPCGDFIEYLKRSKGSDFYSQYMNDPIAQENQCFKREYFQYYDRPPHDLSVALTIDLAFSETERSDYTALVVAGMDERYNIYVLDTIKGRWSHSQTLENIFQAYDKWKPQAVALETTGTQKPMKNVLESEMMRRKIHFPILELPHTSDKSKEFRIGTLEPPYRNKTVYHAKWMTDLEGELLAYPKSKHNDLSDALASQLEVLSPGGEHIHTQAPDGSWEATLQEAKRMNQPFRDFFHERI